MAQRSLYLDDCYIYLKSEDCYEKRLEIVNELLEKYEDQFCLDVEDEKEFEIHSSRLDFLTFYLLYNKYDPDILSLKQIEYRRNKEVQLTL